VSCTRRSCQLCRNAADFILSFGGVGSHDEIPASRSRRSDRLDPLVAYDGQTVSLIPSLIHVRLPASITI
jgi:hypothetical protein